MKIKFKKEWLLKYKFWLMLAVIPPAWCAAIFILSAVADDIAKKGDAFRTKAKDSKTPPAPGQFNEPGIAKISAEAERLKKEEVTVWQKAYKEQADIFRLPKGFVDKCNTTYGLFAEDVRVLPKDKKLADAPPDQANLVHGEVVDVTAQYFMLKVRGDPKSKEKNNFKQMKFMRTEGIKLKDANNVNLLAFVRIPMYSVHKQIVSVFFQQGKYFGDRFTEPERNEFAKYYRTQLPALLDLIEPLDPVKGEGVVQLADFGYDKVKQLREWADGEAPVAPEPSKAFHFMRDFKMEKVEASDDIWIAQENLWIQEEMYRLIRKANDYVSRFEWIEDPKAEKSKEPVFRNTSTDKNKEVTFRNPYWEIALKLSDNKLQAKFTNLLSRRQKLDFKLKIKMNSARNAEAEVITLPTFPPLNPKGSPTGGDSQIVPIPLKPRVARDGIFEVDQVLTWETAAVRRVEAIHISKVGGANAAGNRGFPDPLVSYASRSAPAPSAAPAQPAKDKDGKPIEQKGAVAIGGNAVGGTTPNSQARDRYIEEKDPVTKQSLPEQLRRLPVAVVLIVEQGQVDRVQTAFNNSRFRFMTTQVAMTHYPGSCRPPSYESPLDPAPMDPMKFAVQPIRDPMKDPMKDPLKAQPRAPRAPVSGGNDELEANMEMVIYGIITIYERIPGRAKNPNPS